MIDSFAHLKKEPERVVIAKVRVLNGKPTLVYDKLNLFEEPYFEDNENGWLRIWFPYKNTNNIKQIQVVLFADTIPLSTTYLPLDGAFYYYTHGMIKELGDKLNVKIYA